MSKATINIPYYICNIKNIYAAYSTMKGVESACATGRLVSTVVAWLLGQKLIDGCLMYYLEWVDKPLEGKSRAVTSADEVLACRILDQC